MVAEIVDRHPEHGLHQDHPPGLTSAGRHDRPPPANVIQSAANGPTCSRQRSPTLRGRRRRRGRRASAGRRSPRLRRRPERATARTPRPRPARPGTVARRRRDVHHLSAARLNNSSICPTSVPARRQRCCFATVPEGRQSRSCSTPQRAHVQRRRRAVAPSEPGAARRRRCTSSTPGVPGPQALESLTLRRVGHGALSRVPSAATSAANRRPGAGGHLPRVADPVFAVPSGSPRNVSCRSSTATASNVL